MLCSIFMVKFENKLCHTALSRLDKPRAWLGFTVFILDKRKEGRLVEALRISNDRHGFSIRFHVC